MITGLRFLRSGGVTLAAVLVACGLTFAAGPDVVRGTAVAPISGNSTDSVLVRAQQAFNEGSFGRAAALYEEAAKLQPRNGVAFDGLGRSYERLAETSAFPGRLVAKARKNYQVALNLNPQSVEALQGLIEMHTQPVGVCYGNLNEAALLVEQLNHIDPALAEINRFRLKEAVRESRAPEIAVRCGYQVVPRTIAKVTGVGKSIGTVR